LGRPAPRASSCRFVEPCSRLLTLSDSYIWKIRSFNIIKICFQTGGERGRGITSPVHGLRPCGGIASDVQFLLLQNCDLGRPAPRASSCRFVEPCSRLLTLSDSYIWKIRSFNIIKICFQTGGERGRGITSPVHGLRPCGGIASDVQFLLLQNCDLGRPAPRASSCRFVEPCSRLLTLSDSYIWKIRSFNIIKICFQTGGVCSHLHTCLPALLLLTGIFTGNFSKTNQTTACLPIRNWSSQPNDYCNPHINVICNREISGMKIIVPWNFTHLQCKTFQQLA